MKTKKSKASLFLKKETTTILNSDYESIMGGVSYNGATFNCATVNYTNCLGCAWESRANPTCYTRCGCTY